MKRKRRRKIKFGFIFILLLIASAILFGIYYLKDISFLSKVNYDNFGNITYYDRYGIHLNFKGNFKLEDGFDDAKIVLTNGDIEQVIECDIVDNNGKYKFQTSEYINDGINLERLKSGTYYLLIKAKFDDEDVYFPLINKTEYKDITYYTLTNNGKNKKIDITWDQFEGNEVLGFHIKEASLPDDVYDITIDPGHDGNDAGAFVCENGEPANSLGKCANSKAYKESDLNFEVALALKDELEKLGYKVKMTRDSKSDTVLTYGEAGSGTMANKVKSKFNFALHHNTSNVPGGMSNIFGLEVYVAGDSKFDLARLFVENIKSEANIKVSTKKEFKVEDGIYQRFSSDGITPYYYMIREVGGIATHAYVDGSNTKYDANPYYNSNDTAEGYLFELGYIDNVKELKNILNNPHGYAKGIAQGLLKYLKKY